VLVVTGAGVEVSVTVISEVISGALIVVVVVSVVTGVSTLVISCTIVLPGNIKVVVVGRPLTVTVRNKVDVVTVRLVRRSKVRVCVVVVVTVDVEMAQLPKSGAHSGDRQHVNPSSHVPETDPAAIRQHGRANG
jgi:hypothetical protein